MPGHLTAIHTLHQIQTELDEAESRLSGVPDWMQELHEEHSRYQQEIDTLDTERAEAEKVRRSAEGELADVQEKEKRYQEQISQVSTQREYGALLKEIDTAKQQRSDYEKQAFEAMERFEELGSQLTEKKEGFQDLDTRYKEELTKWEAEKPGIAKRIKELRVAAADAREKVPRQMLNLFDRLYKRFPGRALSRVSKLPARGTSRGSSNAMWHCEVCSYNVRPQIVVEIRTDGSICQCDSCKRILFWEDEKTDEEDA